MSQHKIPEGRSCYGSFVGAVYLCFLTCFRKYVILSAKGDSVHVTAIDSFKAF